ncbi:MAG: leucyl/phenylalanyl-tRNA--protein transferase [Betaproteobacteria bacterium]|nr:leucyl/phenylalanyl-tRNA--protein transferase [Betaproteobacteria bacterium]MCC6249970.1 leucyl/phenylalanyl-tRNA--protein transferase [Rubrivivax sp.]MCL4696615.1 leucyl/phenylalanyl-tRNA--protein transferase [Burkholderiaceae bacterium]
MLTWLDERTPLPSPAQALAADSEAPGLVAAGGRLTVARLEEAYRKGIFPWYSPGQPVLWWSPDPRMVLPTAEFKLSHSLKKTLRRFLRRGAAGGCEFRFDGAFTRVIEHCATTPRPGQEGTWIVPAVVDAYSQWHARGCVHSAETWIDGELAGGLYFVSIGRMVFGESMFSLRPDASKLALAALVAACRARGVPLIDCQQNTGHLASLGAREVPRNAFEAHLARTLGEPGIADWTYDELHWHAMTSLDSRA